MEISDSRYLNRSSGFVDLQPSMFEEPLTGPGDYTIPSFVPEGPFYSFPKAERFMTPLTHHSAFYSSFTPEKYSQLNHQKNRSNSAPVSSFKKFELKDSLIVPGPGSYNLKSTLFDRPVSFKGKYRNLDDNGVPGPGSYQIQNEPILKFAVMKDEKLKNFKNETANVPLVYSELKSATPSYSFRGRPVEKQPTIGPGPGSYQVRSTLYDKGFTIVGKTCGPADFKTPGPGEYNISPDKSGPSFSMSLPWTDLPNNNTPGPGAYNLNSTYSGPRYTMGKRYHSASELDIRDFANNTSTLFDRPVLLRGKPKYPQNSNNPGPGSYSPAQQRGFSGYSYGKGERIPPIENTPGPGQYSPEPKLFSSPCYSMPGRCRENKFEVTPGPGAYNIPEEHGRSTFLRGKPKDNIDNKVPGPGKYSPNKDFKSLSYSQSRANRFEDIEATPGPGDFHWEAGKEGPKYSFTGRHTEFYKDERSPGPGSYEIMGTRSNLAFSLRGKYKEEKPSNVPGPGAYVLNTQDKSAAYSFGHKFDSNFDNQVPGPGNYSQSHHSFSPSWTMSGRPNASQRLIEKSPGPGSYDPQPSFKSLSFTLSGKKDFKIDQTPGPGDYNLQQYKTQGFTFGLKTENSVSDIPGPGTYNPRAKSTNPSWTMAGRPKSPFMRIDKSPGPGQYNIPSTNDKKGCLISKVGRKFSASVTPGPGKYNSKSKMVESNGFSLGKGKRVDFTKIQTETPGPAAYKVLGENVKFKGKFSKAGRLPKNVPDTSGPLYKIDLKPDGPHYSLQGKWDESNQNTTPGPGAYNMNMNNKKKMPAYTMGYKRDIISKLSRPVCRTFTPVRARNK